MTIREAMNRGGWTDDDMALALNLRPKTFARKMRNPGEFTLGQIRTISLYTLVPIREFFLNRNLTNVRRDV